MPCLPRLRVEALEPRDVPVTFTVTSLLDDGSAGTLRWAIGQANASAGDDTVKFQAGLTGTITLNGTKLLVNDPSGGKATIAGPGASVLAVSGNNTTQVCRLSSATDLTGLTVTGGRKPGGGPHMKVLDGTTLTEVWGRFVFDASATGGVEVG